MTVRVSEVMTCTEGKSGRLASELPAAGSQLQPQGSQAPFGACNHVAAAQGMLQRQSKKGNQTDVRACISVTAVPWGASERISCQWCRAAAGEGGEAVATGLLHSAAHTQLLPLPCSTAGVKSAAGIRFNQCVHKLQASGERSSHTACIGLPRLQQAACAARTGCRQHPTEACARCFPDVVPSLAWRQAVKLPAPGSRCMQGHKQQPRWGGVMLPSSQWLTEVALNSTNMQHQHLCYTALKSTKDAPAKHSLRSLDLLAPAEMA